MPKRKMETPSELLAHYVGSSFIAMLTWWIDNKHPCSAEEMNEYFRKLGEPRVMAIMRG